MQPSGSIDPNVQIKSNASHKREGMELDDSNPYAEFCPGISPRKKIKTEHTKMELKSEDISCNAVYEEAGCGSTKMEQGELAEDDESLASTIDQEKTDSPKPKKTEVLLAKESRQGTWPTMYQCQGPGCQEEFTSLPEHDAHYKSRHCNICTECKRSLKSRHLLDLHLMEKHDSYFATVSLKIPSFLCLIETCVQRFMCPEERRVHCLSEHPYLKKFLRTVSDLRIIAVEPFSKQGYTVPVKKKSTKVITMEEDLDNTNHQLTEQTSSPVPHEKLVSKSVVVPKKMKPLHISFGHHGERFIPRQVFAMQARKDSATTKSNMAKVDLSDLQQSLQS